MVRRRNLFIGEAQGRTESCVVRGDETFCTEIPWKKQGVHTGVLEHDAHHMFGEDIKLH